MTARKKPATTREEWLVRAVDTMRDWFTKEGKPLPDKVRITMSLPKGSVTKVIGQCWAPCVSKDATVEVFINPSQDDPVRVLDIVLHELVHAAGHRNGFDGHGKEFKALATSLGLTGQMTATVASPELKDRLTALSDRLGPFPHAAMSIAGRGETVPSIPGDGPRFPLDGPKPQKARMFKVTCTGDHGDDGAYVIRVARKWIAEGLPTCPLGHAMEVTDPNYTE
jgi:hypothetical protein